MEDRKIRAYKHYFTDFIDSLDENEAKKVFYVLDMLKTQERVSWFGNVKPALQQNGFDFFYWNYADNTFAVRTNNQYDLVFETSTLIKAENVSGFVKTLADNIENKKLGFNIVNEIVTAKEKKENKKKEKSGPFVMVVSDEEKKETAKMDKIVMMNELFFKGIMDEYLEKNSDVKITICKVDKNVDLGIDYHGCFFFMLSVQSSSVEDGTAVSDVQNLLEEMDKYNVRCKLV